MKIPELSKILLSFLSLLLLFVVLLSSCSTTKVLQEGETRLKRNVVTITNAKEHPEYRMSDIENYIRQQSNTYFIKTKKGGWDPFLYVANWTNGKGKGWDKFVTKLGQKPVVFDIHSVESSKTNIATRLKYIGYYNSKVQASVDIRNKETVVYYYVTLGNQYPIKEVRYKIADSNIEQLVLADTLNSLIKKGMPLSEQLLNAETDRITEYLKNCGYFEFVKNYIGFTADTVSVKGNTILELIINNYISGESQESAHPHRKFYFGKIDIFPVSDNIRYRASVINKIPQILDTVDYDNITILYDKNRRIRPSVLDRMNTIVPHEPYSATVVNNTYRRLSNLRLYSSVNIELNKADTNVVDCFIRLLPSKIHGYKLNLEASSNSSGLFGISPALSYYNRNIFKGGEWLSLSVMGNFQFSVKNSTRATEFGASAGLSFPNFLLLPGRLFKQIVPRTDLSITYNYQRRPEYTRNMIGGNFGWSWGSADSKFYYKVVPLQINIVNLPTYSSEFMQSLTNPFVREAYKNHFEFGLGFNIQYRTDPNINPDKSYFKAELQFDMSGNLLSAFNKFMDRDTSGYHTIWDSPYSQFVRGELSLSYTWKFGKDNKQALAVRALGGVGYAYGNSAKMPFERLFWAGGSNSLRGWAARSVGPGASPMDSTFSIPNQTGDMRLEANIEYRFPLFSVFRGAVFADWGNVWNVERLENDPHASASIAKENTYFSLKNMFRTSALSWGVGLRLDLNFVVVRLDYGMKLYDPSTAQWKGVGSWFKRGGYAVQFGIGYPF